MEINSKQKYRQTLLGILNDKRHNDRLKNLYEKDQEYRARKLKKNREYYAKKREEILANRRNEIYREHRNQRISQNLYGEFSEVHRLLCKIEKLTHPNLKRGKSHG